MPSRSRAKLVAGLVLITVAVLLVWLGATAERELRHRDRQRYTRIGSAVDIGRRTLNLFCAGSGNPPVIFETFNNVAGFSWTGVQPRVAAFTQSCWYDRAGHGWSDPDPRTSTLKSTAEDLHALMAAAHISAPFVFVGTGDAALEIRVYNNLFPGEAGGIVLADANGVDDSQDIPASAKGYVARYLGGFAPEVRKDTCAITPLVADIGLFRLIGTTSHPHRTDAFDLNPDQQTELDFLSDNLTARPIGGMCASEERTREVRAAGGLGSVPLIVLASRNRFRSSNRGEEAMWDAWNKHQEEVVQPAIAGLSERGRLVLADIPITGNDIVNAVRQLIDTAPAFH